MNKKTTKKQRVSKARHAVAKRVREPKTASAAWTCGMCSHESPARFRKKCQKCGAEKGMGMTAKPARAERTKPASRPARVRRAASTPAAAAPLPDGRPALKPGSTMEKLVTMLRRPGGVTLEDAMAASGWLPHTTRAFMAATLPKRIGEKVLSEKIDGKRTYSLPPAGAAA